MNVKINKNILSIPPYLSIPWKEIASLYLKDEELIVVPKKGDLCEVPGLTEEQIEKIFHFHAQCYDQLDREERALGFLSRLASSEGVSGMQIAIAASPADITNPMVEHNPELADAPDIPHEILEKIQMISKMVESAGGQSPSMKQEHGCNCFHCQIARVLSPSEEPSCQQQCDCVDGDQVEGWSIIQTGDRLFSVTKNSCPQEVYEVHLGDPVSCTCGKRGCEHLLVVLKS